MPQAFPQRLNLLDILRGLAALAVLVWHWQHFWFDPVTQTLAFVDGSSDRSVQPFYALLAPLYNYGYVAVDLFFSISGFIFYFLYAERIAQRQVGAGEFALLRFSRLYPLHLITLLLVAGLQALYIRSTGVSFVYPYNDAYHFVLNLFFAGYWGVERGDSFNQPIWSVSIEVLLYAFFFLLCWLRWTKPLLLIGLAALGLVLSLKAPMLGRGLLSFFIGGLCFYAYAAMHRSPHQARWRAALTAVIVLGLILIPLIDELLLRILQTIPALAASERFAPERAALMVQVLAMKTTVFPAAIVLLALLEEALGERLRALHWIGEITYSTYLLHFPLQLCVVLALAALGLRVDFTAGWVFIAFVGTLLVLAVLCFRYVERPAQRAIRRWAQRRGMWSGARDIPLRSLKQRA